ncbi:AraC family transcriptional regulator [Aureisphaera galaxeae]|uniref:AraC family transcriptional regulator n=1 Tax=Aureisphaera galaxeae TaxID=1538023 RepID=UPI00234FE71C|nr:helix-turn-helix domain-containing protein [Aureisphaera galaxeae]
MLNIWEIIFLFFSFQALIMAVFFFFKRKGDKIANRILGVYLLFFSLNIAYNVLYWSKLLFKDGNVHLFGILSILWISYPPLIYLYTRRVVENKKFSFKDIVHAIPVLAIIGFHIPFFILSTQEKQEALFNGTLGAYIINLKYNFAITILLMIFYAVLAFITFRNKKLGLNKNRWITWLLGSFSCYVIAMATYFVLSRLGLITTAHDYFITYTLIFFIGLVTYFGLVQPDVFNGLSMDKVLPFKKYKNTGLTRNHSLELKNALLEVMRTKKPHLDSTLRLDNLAEMLNLSRHHTSQIINEHFDTNFFDFINGYRIEEAKDLLVKEENLNITDIIYTAGFNNRASFYNTFKKHTGMTPSQFKLEQPSL